MGGGFAILPSFHGLEAPAFRADRRPAR